ncbi:MurT ligase domain-containing protein [Collinsella stercoris]|uniref:MurT ligase domain-containing protein n=1 Tax=Collinsella stercoris TaxID=147206 RepID=UPI003AEF5622
MSIKSTIATATAGAARWGLRSVLHRSGGALPGKLGLAIDPELVTHLACLLDASVVITGTNGKTTTTNLIADAVAASGASCVCNRAGNNMETGITGALLEANSDRRRTAGTRRVGVFECDELYTVRILPRLKPTYFVLLNLFRDQLDRYGEIDHTQDVIAQALALSPTTTLIFNADDPLCASIADRVPNPSLPFGLNGPTGGEASHIAESRFCAHCNAPLEYDYVQYGQLGSYHCPACGWRRPDLASGASNVHLTSTGYSFELKVQQDGSSQTASLSTRYNGLYMVYNITAAWTAAWVLDALDGDSSRFQGVLDTYVPTGGRMTRWQAKGRIVATDLAKNPVGFDRQIQQIKASGGKLMAFYLNDADADGHDVSWIWDVDFECLSAPGVRAFAGGSRAHDLQVRLKYAGIDASLVNGIGDVIDTLAGEDVGEVLHAVANYTAFPPIVKELEGLGDVVTGDAKTVSIDMTPVHDDDDTPRSDKMLDLDRPLRIVHLYPDALNLYGDGGNAIVLERRCRWRGIPVEVDDVRMGDVLDLSTADIVLIGGGADRDQLAVADELRHQRDELQGYVEDDGVVLAICGSYQLLGRSYYMGDEKVEGLGIIAGDTVRGEGRLTGNVAVKTDIADAPFVGFENHGGRTMLDACEHPLGTSVLEGTGNNGQDGSEGCLHRNLVGTYLHGPALSKNPELADWLIARALERRGRGGDMQAQELLPLATLDDACEHAAHEAAMKLLG